MQLGVMSCIHTALDIPERSELGQAVRKSRAYMPRGHRAFVEVFDRARPLIRTFVERSDNVLLREGFNEALATMMAWKQMHHRRGVVYFKGAPRSQGMETSTGLVITEGENLLTCFEAAMEERIAETEQAKLVADISAYTSEELEYLEELKLSFADDNFVSGDERRLLDRTRSRLGISPERAAGIEASGHARSTFRSRDLEYVSHLELALSEQPELSEEARCALRELASELRLSDERVAVLAHFARRRYTLGALSESEREYLDELRFCLANDGRVSSEERRHLIRTRKRLQISEARAYEIEEYDEGGSM